MKAAHHTIGAGVAVTAFVANHDLKKHGRITGRTVLCGALATRFGSIPDWIEPATCPNHRKFFHSLVVLGLVGYGAYRIYQWEPEEDWQEIVKWVGMVALLGYGTHLLMDASTPKGLPII